MTRTTRLLWYAGSVVFLWWTGEAALSEERHASRGAALMHACAACHGPDGRSRGAIPTIHNLSEGQLVDALRAYRSGARPGTVMNRIAKGLSDDDIAALAAHATR